MPGEEIHREIPVGVGLTGEPLSGVAEEAVHGGMWKCGRLQEYHTYECLLIMKLNITPAGEGEMFQYHKQDNEE